MYVGKNKDCSHRTHIEKAVCFQVLMFLIQAVIDELLYKLFYSRLERNAFWPTRAFICFLRYKIDSFFFVVVVVPKSYHCRIHSRQCNNIFTDQFKLTHLMTQSQFSLRWAKSFGKYLDSFKIKWKSHSLLCLYFMNIYCIAFVSGTSTSGSFSFWRTTSRWDPDSGSRDMVLALMEEFGVWKTLIFCLLI